MVGGLLRGNSRPWFDIIALEQYGEQLGDRVCEFFWLPARCSVHGARFVLHGAPGDGCESSGDGCGKWVAVTLLPRR